MKPSKPALVVCAVVTDHDGRYLAAKRPRAKVLAGKWEFPGGKVKRDEAPEDALRREIREEFGVDIAILQRIKEVIHEYDFGTIHLIPFLAKIIHGNPIPIEHDEVRWLSCASLTSLDWAAADRIVVQHLKNLGAAEQTW